MELKEFIKTAISDITEAVSELQEELKNGTIVNPSLTQGEHGKTLVVDNEVRMMERLNFDIAVTATEATELNGNAKAGIRVFGVKVGAENKERTENVSRLTFSLPLVLPTTHVKTQLEKMRERRQQ
ncbi:MAG: trypco2 family protein [Alloprevotella sp.]|nr:trypco2 family protein [Alloprevotella sp.]